MTIYSTSESENILKKLFFFILFYFALFIRIDVAFMLNFSSISFSTYNVILYGTHIYIPMQTVCKEKYKMKSFSFKVSIMLSL